MCGRFTETRPKPEIIKRFGIGKVVKMEGMPPNIKATVFFQNHGQKQLLLKFAKLKIQR